MSGAGNFFDAADVVSSAPQAKSSTPQAVFFAPKADLAAVEAKFVNISVGYFRRKLCKGFCKRSALLARFYPLVEGGDPGGLAHPPTHRDLDHFLTHHPSPPIVMAHPAGGIRGVVLQ